MSQSLPNVPNEYYTETNVRVGVSHPSLDIGICCYFDFKIKKTDYNEGELDKLMAMLCGSMTAHIKETCE